MEVVLTDNYKSQLENELVELIRQTLKHETEKLIPPKEILNKSELKKFFGVGDSFIDTLITNGLEPIQFPNSRQLFFDLQDVYTVMRRFKITY